MHGCWLSLYNPWTYNTKPEWCSKANVCKIFAIINNINLISTIWWQKIVSYILLVKNLGHFGIVADSVILENQDTRVEHIITMQIFEANYLATLAFMLFFFFLEI